MRSFAIIAASALLIGSVTTLAVKVPPLLTLMAAKREISARRYTVIAVDLEPRLRCPKPTAGFTFHATRDGHLIVGGGCVAPFGSERTIVVALPPVA